MTDTMLAPFAWFGGKSRVAALVWQRFGDVPNYVEPFAGSLAVLLGRPHAPKTETVNDLDGLLANFWRAVKLSPEAVAEWADWPVSEPDLHARHLWLVNRMADLPERLMADPDWHDAKIAGWWLWGICQWIGTGWCSGDGPWQAVDGVLTKGDAGRGINRQLPHLGDAGRGINRQLPCLGNARKSVNRDVEAIRQIMADLSTRLRRVRVACGDWTRVCGPSVTCSMQNRNAMLTAVFLDPPYPSDNRAEVYSHDCRGVAADVRRWALDNGGNPLLRIALCGYDGEHDMPSDWECVAWKAKGGYGGQGDGDGRANSARERIWFSPHCLSARQASLL